MSDEIRKAAEGEWHTEPLSDKGQLDQDCLLAASRAWGNIDQIIEHDADEEAMDLIRDVIKCEIINAIQEDRKRRGLLEDMLKRLAPDSLWQWDRKCILLGACYPSSGSLRDKLIKSGHYHKSPTEAARAALDELKGKGGA